MNVRISALLFLMATLLGTPTVAYSKEEGYKFNIP
jgi:hypothetical protein